LPESYKAYSKMKPIHKSEFENLRKWWTNRKANEQAWKVSIDDLTKNGYNLDIKNPHIAEEEHTYSSSELLEMLHVSFKKSDELLEQLKSELINE
ncbi:MAG: SAM-dependent methyltransferase, partial [Calditrichales bacterium]|nr:SAM-dependent methyltransferase [Calditrichales bacterium]